MATKTQIVSMERAEAGTRKSPMWRCTTADGERVNAFDHYDPSKNTFKLFVTAGYGEVMRRMELGERLRWRKHPIDIQMVKSGEWWNITHVHVAPDDAEPDPPVKFKPDYQQYHQEAALWARNLLETEHLWVVWDTETTGLDDDDEILTIGLIVGNNGEKYSALIKPQQMNRVEVYADVHGITVEQAEKGEFFPDVYREIRPRLQDAIWVIYNAEFDARMLENMCLRYGMSPIFPVATVDAMTMFSRFCCEWDEKKQRLKTFTLSDAAAHMGVSGDIFHDAAEDAATTLRLILEMAKWSDLR